MGDLIVRDPAARTRALALPALPERGTQVRDIVRSLADANANHRVSGQQRRRAAAGLEARVLDMALAQQDMG